MRRFWGELETACRSRSNISVCILHKRSFSVCCSDTALLWQVSQRFPSLHPGCLPPSSSLFVSLCLCCQSILTSLSWLGADLPLPLRASVHFSASPYPLMLFRCDRSRVNLWISSYHLLFSPPLMLSPPIRRLLEVKKPHVWAQQATSVVYLWTQDLWCFCHISSLLMFLKYKCFQKKKS